MVRWLIAADGKGMVWSEPGQPKYLAYKLVVGAEPACSSIVLQLHMQDLALGFGADLAVQVKSCTCRTCLLKKSPASAGLGLEVLV